EEPRLDLQSRDWSAIPGLVRLLPGGERQVVAIIRIAHQTLNLAEHGGVVRREGFFDCDRVVAHGGRRRGLGSAHESTLGGVDYREFIEGLRIDYGVAGAAGSAHATSGTPSGDSRWIRALPVSATYSRPVEGSIATPLG